MSGRPEEQRDGGSAPRAESLVLDGCEVAIEEGETLLTLARRHGAEIPTLCHDPRLDPAGACRTCLVEVEANGVCCRRVRRRPRRAWW